MSLKNGKLSVILVTDAYWPSIGGVEQWVHGVAACIEKNYSVSVITHAPGAPFDWRFIALAKTTNYADNTGLRVIALGPTGIGRLALAPLFMWHLPFVRSIVPSRFHDVLYFFYQKAFLKTFVRLFKDADLVHCFSTRYLAVCAAQACARLRIPCVQSPPVHFGKWGDSPLLLSTYAKARAIACLSHDFKTRFLQHLPAATVSMFVIPAPVEAAGALQEPRFPVQKQFILFLGRREPHKGLALLLDAFKSIRPPVTLVIAGPGSRQTTLPDRVTDVGAIAEPEKQWLLEHCSILCVPSMEESFGIVYAEAMAHAKPVVALNIAPVNEIALHGRTGLLTEPGRADRLAEAIMSLIHDEALSRRMGEEGLKRFSELFDASRVTQRLLSLYGSILGGSSM